MRNTSRKAYPKRNASVPNPKPKYAGKKLWRSGDTRIKCRDCHLYASHEVEVVREPDPWNKADKETVSMCATHARKAVATSQVIRLAPFDEWAAHTRALAKWESNNAPDLQEALL